MVLPLSVASLRLHEPWQPSGGVPPDRGLIRGGVRRKPRIASSRPCCSTSQFPLCDVKRTSVLLFNHTLFIFGSQMHGLRILLLFSGI
jgi:hypothetical protein